MAGAVGEGSYQQHQLRHGGDLRAGGRAGGGGVREHRPVRRHHGREQLQQPLGGWPTQELEGEALGHERILSLGGAFKM
jgi:hypothetical protein